MMYLLIIPAFIFYEVKYLIGHPKTFNGLAALLWFIITAISFIFLINPNHLGFMPVTHIVAIMVYYMVKLPSNAERRRALRPRIKIGQDKRRPWPTKRKKERY